MKNENLGSYTNGFKYAGSKLSMLPHIIKDDVIPFFGNILVEPFLGSCSLLLNTEYKKYYFNDINPYIVDFFKIILSSDLDKIENYFNLLVNKFANDDATNEEKKNKSKEFYYKCRDLYFEKFEKLEEIQRAALFAFLMYNGFGGKPMSTSISCGDTDRKAKLRIEVYKAMQAKKDRIYLYSMDYKDFIKEVLKRERQENITLYLDPTYVDSFKYDASNNVNDIAKDLKKYFDEYDFFLTVQSNFKNDNVMKKYQDYNIIEVDRKLSLQSGKEETGEQKEKQVKTELIIIKSNKYKATREFELKAIINYLKSIESDERIINTFTQELLTLELKKQK